MNRADLRPHHRCTTPRGVGTLSSGMVVLLIFGATGCSHPQSDQGEGQTTIASADLVPLADDSLLVEPRDAAFAGDHILVLNSAAPFVTEYGADGTLLRRFGAAGQGPGELQLPVAIAARQDGEIDLLDAQRRAIVRFGADRSVLPDRPMTGVIQGVAGRSLSWIYGRPGELRPVADGWVYYRAPRMVGQTGDLNAGQLLHLRAVDSTVDTIVDFGARASALAAQLDGRLENRELVPVPLWDVCNDSTLVVYDPVDNTVTLRSRSGRALRTDTLRWTATPLGDHEYLRSIGFQLRSMMRGHGTMTGAQVQQLSAAALETRRAVFGTRSPLAFDLLCDGSERIFIGRFSIADHPLGFGQTWAEIGGGPGDREWVFPKEFRLMTVARGWGVGWTTDSTGTMRLFRVSLPSAPRN